ncbi:hypothetical protein C5167_008449 [Papaver somniferum]|uniref:Protein kinase domain-containing protein n=1 Tax=Papaver somniferum TaxID=3469 RepID=A0A4Y7JYH9_PAPSO|nr:putative receptor-like protein kinase At4g00960 [Papaver somniferum]RZC64769.1 hypothetical protein C5167_008449 [Papaver somniferum]
MGSFSQILIKILSTILIFNHIQYCYVLKTNAQIDTSNIFPLCSGDNITSNTYRSNLKLLLSSLTNSFNKTIILNGYYNDTVGRKPNTAYGNYQCRGDITLEDCRSTVDLAVKEVQRSCPDSKEAVITYKEIVALKFSDQSYFSTMRDSPYFPLPNANSVTNPDEFNSGLDELENYILEKVAFNGVSNTSSSTNRNLYGIGSIDVSSSQKIYGLAHCTADLSVKNCTQCLRGIMDNYRKSFSGRVGGRVICWSCYFRYETYRFYGPNATSPPFPSPNIMNPPPSKPKISRKVLLIIIVVPSVITTVLSIIIILYFCVKRRKKVLERKIEDIDEIQSAESLQYKFNTIGAATQNFSDANKLGRGGFGTVYKGTMPDGQEIAVKRLSENSGQGEEEFRNEVVLLAKLQHKNLVRLLGFCLDGDEKLLVYEFMQHGSLDQFLFDPIKRALLNWERRYKIIGGIAKGLLYLHEDSRLKIIHRDLKASNVLLGEDMVPKISDFGMVRMVNQNQVSTKRICGTFGYMAPEYAMHGKFSAKSDVFSFGVLILEILCGKRSNSFGGFDGAKNVLSYAWGLWEEGKSVELLEPSLRDCYSPNEVMRCIQIGLLCAQKDVANRPTMAWIIHMLNNHCVILPSPLAPSTFVLRGETELNIPSEDGDNISVNQVSMTEFYPR